MKILILAFLLQIAFVYNADARSHHHSSKGSGSRLRYGTPGDFSSYVFSMSYERDFCGLHPRDAFCGSLDSFPALTLHGLWPEHDDDRRNQYSFCGLRRNPIKGKNWCAGATDMKSQISRETFQAMSLVMPDIDVNSCLYNHEWYEHGSCSGLGAEDYFSSATHLALQVETIRPLNDLLLKSRGKQVDLQSLTDVLKKGLPNLPSSAFAFECRKVRATGEMFFTALILGLKKNDLLDLRQPDAFVDLDKEKIKSCPDAGIQIAP